MEARRPHKPEVAGSNPALASNDDDDDLIVTGYQHKDRSMTWAVHKPRKRPTVVTTDESFRETWKTNKAKATRKSSTKT